MVHSKAVVFVPHATAPQDIEWGDVCGQMQGAEWSPLGHLEMPGGGVGQGAI